MGKFKEKHGKTRVGKFLSRVGNSEIIERVVSATGDIVTGDTLGAIKTIITGSNDMSQEDKEMALELLELDKKELEEVTKRWESDMSSSSFLSKNVRPITLLFLLFSMFLFCFLDSFASLSVRDVWVSMIETLLALVIVAYFGSRGYEKIKKVSK